MDDDVDKTPSGTGSEVVAEETHFSNNRQLRKGVVELLGNMENDLITHVVGELGNLGVFSIDDLQWVQEDDLVGILKPVHARKLLRSFAQRSLRSGLGVLVPESPGCSTSSHSTCSSPMSGTDQPAPIIYDNTDPNWPSTIALTRQGLSSSLMCNLEKGNRLQPRDKREFVRHVVDHVRHKTTHPTRAQMTIIARRWVNMYPDSLEDRLGNTIIGCGYETLLAKMVFRNENMNRAGHNLCLSKKRASTTDPETTDCQKKDSYGCVRWSVNISESKSDELEQIRGQLVDKHLRGDKMDNSIAKDMSNTYPLQRLHINEGQSLQDLRTSWPYLFTVEGLLTHSQHLLGLDLRKTLKEAYNDKGNIVKTYLINTLDGEEIYEEAETKTNNQMYAWLAGTITLLMKYFNEDIDCLFTLTDVTSSGEDVERASKTEAPVLVVLGDSFFSEEFSIMCDHVLVCEKDDSFVDMFTALFGSFYNFNLQYPKYVCGTMEFVQRCFFGINPSHGSKSNKSKKKKTVMNTKVLNLIGKLADMAAGTKAQNK